MITVSVKQLVSAIAEADAFKMPEMNEGTAYLYHTIYSNLSQNKDVKLSEIDFDAFEADDINCLNDLHSDVLEKNCCTANGIITTLQQISPICKAVGYV